MSPIRRRWGLSLLLALAAGPAVASTDGPTASWALNEFGGTAAERQALYAGSPGVLLATSPAAWLFVAWRRLHGQAVAPAAGEALAVPCCNAVSGGASGPVTAWLEARKTVPGVAPMGSYLDVERPGPDSTTVPNCLDDAFRNATATLAARVAAYGADTPAMRAWVAAQDAVFTACSKPATTLPPLPDQAPDWLAADYRYQSAARLFYIADYDGAAAAFSQIGADIASPWHDLAPLLRVRALLRKALASGKQGDFAAAQAEAAGIAPGARYHDAAARLGNMAQLHADPAAARTRLVAAVMADPLTEQAASDFKDLQTLAANGPPPDALDWIATFKTGASAPPAPRDSTGTLLEQARAAEVQRRGALAHAKERYAAGHDPAWLVAVLALMQPDEAADGPFVADAAATDAKAPAYLTALYHRIRLTIGSADPAGTRAALDAVLARTDLPSTTRNLFLAERMLVGNDLAEFGRFAQRRPVCTKDADGCKNGDWGYSGTGGGLFDAEGDAATIGWGDDARYLVDRMALAPRMALSEDKTIPAAIRMDIALTNFARAVLLHDDAAADRMAGALQALLPGMAADFAAIPAAAKGADRQFALYFIFAKIPGLRVDLVDYVRPVGAPADFAGSWPNWVVLARPDPDSIPPSPALYDNAGYQAVDVPAGTDLGEGHRRVPDVVCTGMCGAGGFVPQAPAFLASTATAATTERRFLPPPGKYGDVGSHPGDRMDAFPGGDLPNAVNVVAPPAGATFVWEFLLDYVTGHPREKRAAETLHWLIHVGHYGQSHNHSGQRAFKLLKSRYPESSWAKQNEFFYD